MSPRALRAAALAALISVAPGFVMPVAAAQAAAAGATPADPAVASAPKVVIVVGATGSVTSTYRSDADAIYAEAIKWTPNVVKLYSPNATWAAVRNAAQGATILVYLGHGYGFPSPYRSTLTTTVQDGFGLNATAGAGDDNTTYYGEYYIGRGIRLAKNAIVILNHLCYASGNSESGNPEPTIPQAKERVDNFASGFLRAGARAIIADTYDGAAEATIRAVFSTHQTLGTMWTTMWDAHGHFIPFVGLRNPAYSAVMDPTYPTSQFYRSIEGNLAMTTDDVVAGAAAPFTGIDPATLQAPGAASVAAGGAEVATDASLATPSGSSLAAGTSVRVTEIVPGSLQPDGTTSVTAVHVHTFDGSVDGWVSAAILVPRDSASPQLWSMDGPLTISPNLDGLDDTVNLVARFSESAAWTVHLLDPGSKVLATMTGSGHQAFVTWDPVVGSVTAPDGTYGWTVHATDAWGNPALDASGSFTISNAPTPLTGVLGFGPTASPTNLTTVTYSLLFDGPVTGLQASDLYVTGTASGCVVGAPSGSGTTYTVPVSGCSPGTPVLTLEPGSVTDATSTPGPAGAISAPGVLIDRTAPTTTAPRASLRSGVVVSGSALPVSVAWSGSDSGGAGVKGYDLAQSVDGGSFVVIRSGLTSPSVGLTASSGHTYRYEARTWDRAGNHSGWVAGPTLAPTLYQDSSSTVVYGGAWSTASSTSYSGGAAHYATATGRTASFTFNGRSVAFVTRRCMACGAVKIYLDGAYVTTVDLYSASDVYRSVAYARTYSTSGTHTLRLVVVGTAGRPRVTVDAIEVVR